MDKMPIVFSLRVIIILPYGIVAKIKWDSSYKDEGQYSLYINYYDYQLILTKQNLFLKESREH